jgi:inner membrane protein
MPSPVGHALAGYAVGTLVAGRPGGGRTSALDTVPGRLALFAGLACLPDIDFLFRSHSMYTHSVGAVFIVAVVAALVVRSPLALVAACAVAYGSHLLLDWLGRDTNPPLGIMALWPFSRDYYMSPVPLLEPVSRRFRLPNFWRHNFRVVGFEILLFGAMALAAHLGRGRTRGAGQV